MGGRNDEVGGGNDVCEGIPTDAGMTGTCRRDGNQPFSYQRRPNLPARVETR